MDVIEVLAFDGCPNTAPTMQRVRAIARHELPDAQILEVTVAENEVDARRFLGSPSVRINGVDVDPSARSRTDFHYGCRMYDTRAGLTGVPLDVWIRTALQEARGPKPLFERGRTCRCAAECWCRTGFQRRVRWIWPARHITA